jgi:hypothetical protein
LRSVTDKLLQSPFERGALQEQAAPALQAAQADVRAKTRNLPVVAAAGMGLSQSHYVAQADFEDG